MKCALLPCKSLEDDLGIFRKSEIGGSAGIGARWGRVSLSAQSCLHSRSGGSWDSLHLVGKNRWRAKGEFIGNWGWDWCSVRSSKYQALVRKYRDTRSDYAKSDWAKNRGYLRLLIIQPFTSVIPISYNYHYLRAPLLKVIEMLFLCQLMGELGDLGPVLRMFRRAIIKRAYSPKSPSSPTMACVNLSWDGNIVQSKESLVWARVIWMISGASLLSASGIRFCGRSPCSGSINRLCLLGRRSVETIYLRSLILRLHECGLFKNRVDFNLRNLNSLLVIIFVSSDDSLTFLISSAMLRIQRSLS